MTRIGRTILFLGTALYVAYCFVQVAIVAPDSLTWTFDRPWGFFWPRDIPDRHLVVLSCVGAAFNMLLFAGFVYLMDCLCRAPTDAAAMREAEAHPELAQPARMQWQLWQLFVFTTACAVSFAVFRGELTRSHEEAADYMPLPVAYLRFHVAAAVVSIGLTITVLAIEVKSRWRAPRRAWQPGEWLLLAGGAWVLNALVFKFLLSSGEGNILNWEAFRFIEIATRLATSIFYLVAAVRVGRWSAWRLFFALEGGWELLSAASELLESLIGPLVFYLQDTIAQVIAFVLGLSLLTIAVLRERPWWKWRNGFHKIGIGIFLVFAVLHSIFQIAMLFQMLR